MPNFKNLELITATVTNFIFSDLKFVKDFKYELDMDTVKLFDQYNTSKLLINFVLIPGGETSAYKVTIHFKNVSSLQLASSGVVIQLSWFEILDISDRGWESVKYIVRDMENEEEFNFHCNDIEVIAIEEVEWFTE